MQTNDLIPLLWLGLLALAVAAHLVFHRLNYVLKDAFRWMVAYPAPVLIYASSLIAAGLLQWRFGSPYHVFETDASTPLWAVMLLRGIEDLAWLFHRAVIPLPFGQGTAWGSFIQSLIASLSQVMLCAYFVLTLQGGDNLLRRTLARVKARWSGVLIFTLLQWPWWHFIAWQSHPVSTMAKFFYLELLLLLAPFSLVLVVAGKNLSELISKMGLWWSLSGKSLMSLAITFFPLLALQAYALHLSEQYLLENWSPIQVLLRCIIVATLHTWFFLCAALLMVSAASTSQILSQRRPS